MAPAHEHSTPPPSRWSPAVVGVVVAIAAMSRMLLDPEPYTLHIDNRLVMFPLTFSAWRGWLHGRIPEWTDGIWSGFPLIAEPQSAVFYPLHWVTFALTGPSHLRAFDLATDRKSVV